jgi:hypothetical protein
MGDLSTVEKGEKRRRHGECEVFRKDAVSMRKIRKNRKHVFERRFI